MQQQEAEKEQLEKQLQSAADKLMRVSKQQKKREKEAERDLEKARSERAKAEAELQQSENKAAENGVVAEKMERKLVQVQEAHAAEASKMRDLYGVLENQVRSYHAQLRQALAAPSPQ